MGVWIETYINWKINISTASHTLYGCVDWNNYSRTKDINSKESHPVWVCGLKPKKPLDFAITQSHTLYGRVFKIYIIFRHVFCIEIQVKLHEISVLQIQKCDVL